MVDIIDILRAPAKEFAIESLEIVSVLLDMRVKRVLGLVVLMNALVMEHANILKIYHMVRLGANGLTQKVRPLACQLLQWHPFEVKPNDLIIKHGIEKRVVNVFVMLCGVM